MSQLRLNQAAFTTAIGFLFQAQGLVGYAQSDAASSALVEQIRHANIVNPSYKLQASVSGEEALITTQRKPKSSDADCKIEAVLLAKTVFDDVSDKVQRVKILLLDYDANDCSSVTVKRAEVKLFGTGGLNEKELLSSLEITKTTISGSESTSLSVADGPEQPARLLLLGRIERLKTKGTNVTAFMNYFSRLEESARKGDNAAVKTQTEYLNEKVSEQEEMLKQAKMRAVRTSGGSAGGGTASIAERFAKNMLSPDEETMIALAEQQNKITQKLARLASGGQNTTDAMSQVSEAQRLIEKKQYMQAKQILDQLEQKYGH